MLNDAPEPPAGSGTATRPALPNGKISVTYFEWAASSDQKIIIPWRVIDGPETADAVAQEILKTPIRRASRSVDQGPQ